MVTQAVPPAARPQGAPVLAGFSNPILVGEGGFASVYRYEQDSPRRPVAIKVVSTKHGIDPEKRANFAAEIDLMASLSSHPSVTSLYGSGIAPDGRPYLVMEYANGGFGKLLKEHGPVTLDVALDAGVRLAGALQSAHDAGIIHRDIKPANILIGATGVAQITDFGIAELVRTDDNSQGPVAMSVPWSAPEVVADLQLGAVPAEVWSLGATIYHLITGNSPFQQVAKPGEKKKDVQKRHIRAIKSEPYRNITAPNYDPTFLNQVLAKAMAKDPAQRFQSMSEFAAALQQLQNFYRLPQTRFETLRIAAAPQHQASAQNFEQMRVAGYQTRAERARAQQQAGATDRWGNARAESSQRQAGAGRSGGGKLALIIGGVAVAGAGIAAAVVALLGGL